MTADPVITSLQNPLVKRCISLKEHKKARKASGRFVLEGLREITLALQGEYSLDVVFKCDEILDNTRILETIQSQDRETQLVAVSKKVYERIAYRGKTEGLVAIARAKDHDLASLQLSKNALILVAESPEKPGNIGALLRTADAAGLDAVIISQSVVDLYNPNVIRSSIGCLFTVPVAMGTNREVLEFLTQKKVNIVAASLQANRRYDFVNFLVPTAILVGAEATGLSSFWYDHAAETVCIPMEGSIDSMNVSVSAAILIFEAKRQRRNPQ